MTQVKIYVANLEEYNNGNLVGDWFTLPCDTQEIMEKIGSPEEYAIHDYEAPFEISEYDSIDKLNEIAEKLNSINETNEVIEAIVDHYGLEEALEILEGSEYIMYHNCKDMTDVAHEIIEMHCYLDNENEFVKRYFDYEAFGRDLEFEGNFLQVDYDTYVEVTR